MNATTEIRRYYKALSRAYGPQQWWPARTRFEVIVGAFLTQNTAWTNVEKALRNLRRAGILSVGGIRQTPLHELEQLVRPSGYFRQKASRLKAFVEFLHREYGGSLSRMFAQSTASLREQLLALNGVGAETADAILLYAGRHPVFVVDTYTRRILDRHGITQFKARYNEVRDLFERALGNGTRSAVIFNQAHALIVQVGKNHCRKEASCEGCPLERFLPITQNQFSSQARKRTVSEGTEG
jgi:endonuclease-3 related protein